MIALSRIKGLYESQSFVNNASMFSGNILNTEALSMLLPLYQHFFSFTSLLTSYMEKKLFHSIIPGKCHLSGVSDSQKLSTVAKKDKTLIRNSQCIECNFILNLQHCCNSHSTKNKMADSDDDFRSGCRNVSHCHRQQSFSGLPSPGRSHYTIDCHSRVQTLYCIKNKIITLGCLTKCGIFFNEITYHMALKLVE